MKSYSEMLFGHLAVEHGMVTAEDLESCYALMRQRAVAGTSVGLERIMLDRGLITEVSRTQLEELRNKLERRDVDFAFGRIVVEESLVSVDEVERAIREQSRRSEHVALGALLVELGAMDETELARIQRIAAQRQQAPDSAMPPAALVELARAETVPSAHERRSPDRPPEQGLEVLRPGVRFGAYELIDEVARGGMGIIFRARHLNLGRVVAIKVLGASFSADPVLVRRFIQEAKALALLQHPNIVQVHNVGKVAGTYFLEMEFIEGEDLHDLIVRESPLQLERAVGIAQAVVQALKAAGEKGIVHRDVKPENILLARTGAVKLTDFGIVKMQGVGSAPDGRGGSRVGDMIGTPFYVAPEQARGEPDVDFRADIYSLGATFWRMLTGRPPFEGSSAIDVITKHLHRPLTARKDLAVQMAPEVYDVLCRMLAKSREDRPASWDEVATLLDRLLRLSGCPACGSPMAPDHIICIECGFNRKVGIHLQTTFGPNKTGAPRRSTTSKVRRSGVGGVKRRRRRRRSP